MMFDGLVPNAGPIIPSAANVLGYDLLEPQTGLESGPFIARHLKPYAPLRIKKPDGSIEVRPYYTIRRRPGVTIGKWTGSKGEIDFTKNYLADLCESFPFIVRDMRCWVTINHRPLQDLPGLLGSPQSPEAEPHPRLAREGIAAVLGSISDCYPIDVPFYTSDGRVFQPGEILFFDLVNIPEALAFAIARGNYPRPSLGIEDNFIDTSGHSWAHCIQHFSCEGAFPEAIYSLEDLNRVFYLSRKDCNNLSAVTTEAKQMLLENAPVTTGQTETAPVTQPAPPPVDLSGVDPKLVAILEAFAQAQAQTQGIVQGLAEDVKTLKEAMAADTLAKGDGGGTGTTSTTTPPSTPAPAAETQLSRRLKDLESQVGELKSTNLKTLEFTRKSEATAFAKKVVPPAMVPLASAVLVKLETEGVAAEFARGDGSKVDLHGAFREILLSRLPSAPSAPALKGLKAPSAVGVAEPDQWDEGTCDEAIATYSRENNLSGPRARFKAIDALCQQYGRAFREGMSRPAN